MNGKWDDSPKPPNHAAYQSDAGKPIDLEQSIEHENDQRDMQEQKAGNFARQFQDLPLFFVSGFDLMQDQ